MLEASSHRQFARPSPCIFRQRVIPRERRDVHRSPLRILGFQEPCIEIGARDGAAHQERAAQQQQS
jgi:hypothetical protein